MSGHIYATLCYLTLICRRVGFQEAEQTLKAVLPPSVEALHARWEVVDRPLAAPTWDFMWTGPSEGGRERQFIQRAVLLEDPELPELKAYSSESVYVADGALKVTNVWAAGLHKC